MSEWFTDEELDRIDRFANSPGHSRDPAMLLPEDATDDAATEQETDDDDRTGNDDVPDGTDVPGDDE